MGVGFQTLIDDVAPRLRAALIAAYGIDAGTEAAAEALAWGWEHHDRLDNTPNPAGYLYRVGQTAARRARRPQVWLPEESRHEPPDFEPELMPALEALSEQQRVLVIMVHGLGWPQVDIGQVLRISPSSVAAHLRRAMTSLRESLEVTVDGR